MLPFTMEEAWLDRHPDAQSVHLEQFPQIPADWKDEALAEKWRKVRQVRRVVTGALEIERAKKVIGSSLEAAPVVHITDPELRAALDGLDLAEIAITSEIAVSAGRGAAGAFALDDVRGVASCPALPAAPNARAPGASRMTSARTRSTPTCRRATRRRCANWRRSAACDDRREAKMPHLGAFRAPVRCPLEPCAV